MANVRKSSKAAKGRVCASCHEPKSVSQYASSSDEICLDCQAEIDKQTPESTQAIDEAPFVSTDVELDYSNPTTQELAARTLARRRLIHFIKRFRPKYDAGWVHEDICRRLERFMQQVADKQSPRLLLMMPYRSGKSEISSRHVPPFFLGHHPDWEIIAASNAQSLATSFSRYIRDLMRNPSYQALFPAAKLDPSSQSVESWNTTSGGGYLAAGVGTAIIGRGANCLVGDTEISTTSGKYRLKHLYLLKSPPSVETPFGPRRIMAMTKRQANRLFKVRFTSGAELVSTGEHPIYLPDEKRYVTVEELHGKAKNSDRPDLLVLRQAVSTHALRCGQSYTSRPQGSLLRESVFGSASCGEECETLRDVRETRSVKRERQEFNLLQQGVQTQSDSIVKENMSAMRRGVSTKVFVEGLLRGDLRRYGAHYPYAWGEEFELSHGQRIRVLVRPDETLDFGAGQGVCSVSQQEGVVLPPYQRGSERQLSGEPDHVVQAASLGAPRLIYDTVSVVECCGEVSHDVYDLQVEEAGCFFAENILVGNCLIIDDPVRDAEAADSQVIRDNLWEWYLSTAYSRLAPGGGVLGILTCWNDDDWAGRVQQAMSAGGDQFEIVRYPAVNDQGDEYILEDDSIVQIPPGHKVPLGSKLTRPMNSALHPARYTYDMLMRIKANYYALGQQRWWAAGYQQNPTPEDGLFFTKGMFVEYTHVPPLLGRSICQAWDFAITDTESADYNVGTTILQDEYGSVFVLDMVRFRSDDGIELTSAVVEYAQKWGIVENGGQIGLEDGQIWKSLATSFKAKCDAKQ